MELNDHLFGKELFTRFTVGIFFGLLWICVCASFQFGFEDGVWELIVFILDQYLSVYC